MHLSKAQLKRLDQYKKKSEKEFDEGILTARPQKFYGKGMTYRRSANMYRQALQLHPLKLKEGSQVRSASAHVQHAVLAV